MNTNYLENNHLVLVGKVTSEKKFSHEIYGESFYIFDLEVARLSGNSDIIPITISERLILEKELEIGDKVEIEGQFRSYNSYENEKNRLLEKEYKVKEKKAKRELQKYKLKNMGRVAIWQFNMFWSGIIASANFGVAFWQSQDFRVAF